MLNYARRIMLVPVGVVAQAAGVASYPFLAKLVAANDNIRFTSTLHTALQKALLVCIPLSIWMIVAAQPIISLIFEQGLFTSDNSIEATLLLRIMLLAVTFWTILQLVGRAFYAHQNTLTPALTGTAVTLLSLPLYWLGAIHLGTRGVAIAGVCSVVAYTLCLSTIWVKQQGSGVFAHLAKHMLQLCICAVPAVVGTYYCLLFIPLAEQPLLRAAVQLACSGIVFVILYSAVAYQFIPSLREEIERLKQKIF